MFSIEIKIFLTQKKLKNKISSGTIVNILKYSGKYFLNFILKKTLSIRAPYKNLINSHTFDMFPK